MPGYVSIEDKENAQALSTIGPLKPPAILESQQLPDVEQLDGRLWGFLVDQEGYPAGQKISWLKYTAKKSSNAYFLLVGITSNYLIRCCRRTEPNNY